ncbi:acylphosphatase [Nocardioides sp. 1609]|uniref:acylphosphatase n=1 Tax=Nocardioides sp. 1609 TaxID=2508327 RepID=UPI00106F526C|nr:acylphosphatase [Nocardioides sp. 1609]
MSRAVDLTVTGRVQGVAFRYSAAAEAARLGVTGWVRNEPDGAVAAHVEGADEAVGAMVAWCRTGPPSARVAHVDVAEAEVTGATSFEVTG